MPDARKPLQVLYDEWKDCTKCELGNRRMAVGGNFVFGEGTRRSIMLIDDGPGETEEHHGRPLVGESGKLLRMVLQALGVDEYYLTNLVACRACSPQLDGEGKPIIFTPRRGPPQMRWKDEPPTPTHSNACRTRLEEEIYIVDPVVIVGLGGTACKALLQRNVTITKERGDAEQIEIPGASWRPSLTDKKREWARIKKGKIEDTPVIQNMVSYYFVPTLDPAYVLKKIADRDENSPFRQLVGDIRRAVQVYENYMEIVHGVLPTGLSQVSTEDVYQKYASSEEG